MLNILNINNFHIPKDAAESDADFEDSDNDSLIDEDTVQDIK